MNFILEDEDLGIEVIKAIQTGNVPALERLLAAHPELVTARIIPKGYHDEKSNAFGVSRTLLHVATDWPGCFPNGATVVHTLVDAGAEVDARFTGHHTETPLHWAASSNDAEVIQALLNTGADINATGAVIGEGTPLDDAVAFGQWDAARLLVKSGAQTKLWNVAALGMLDEVKAYYENIQLLPSAFETTQAFWLACHGGQLMAAEYLFSQGADLNWIGYDGLTPLDAAVRSNVDTKLLEWLRSKGAHSAGEIG